MIALCGPTGVGKTEVATELAELLGRSGERPVAVSADAFQVYAGLDTLTAKPTEAELRRLEHRLVSFVPIDRTFSVAEYAGHAHAEIDSLLQAGRRPIVVGGTGLYLRAALTELDMRPAADPELRREVERELAELGVESLHARLPAEVADAVHPRDRKRIVRALELDRMGERPHARSDQLWSDELRRPTLLFGITMDREALAGRVAERVDRMLAAGAVAEVERAAERGASATARKAIGFREVEAHLEGALGLEEAAARIERRHNQYVKRQLTWMRKLAAVELIDRTSLSAGEVAALIVERVAGDRAWAPGRLKSRESA